MGVGTEPESQEVKLRPADVLLLKVFNEELDRRKRKMSIPKSKVGKLEENIKLVRRVIESMSLAYGIPEHRLVQTLKRARNIPN